MAAISANNIWAAGDTYQNGNFTPIIEHWDGTTWSLVPNAKQAGGLSGIAAISANDIWADGSANGNILTEHWDGTQWNYVPNLGQSSDSELDAVVAVGNTFWAVGGHTSPTSPVIAFYC